MGLYRVTFDGEQRFEDAVPIFVNSIGRRRWFGGLPLDALREAGIFHAFARLRAPLFDLYAQVVATGEPFHGAREFETPEGPRVFDLSIAPFAGGLVHVGRDVTDERRALDRLGESEEELRRMIEGIDAIVSYKAPGGATPTLSPQVERLLGYRPEDVAPYERWESLIHPDDHALCRAAWDAPDDVWDMEYRVRHADGHWVWVSDKGRRIPDGRGAGAFGVVTDVTLARQADERFRAVFEENPEAIGIVRPVRDEDGRFQNAEFVAANRAARELFLGGVDSVRDAGLCLFGLVPEIDAALFDAAAAACDQGVGFEGVVHRDLGDHERWVDMALFPFESGLAFVGRDTTAERAAVNALRESEARFRAVTDSAADAIVTFDAADRIVASNPSAERMYGAREGELIGRPVAPLVPGTFGADRAAEADVVAAGEGSPITASPAPLEGHRLDGTTFPVEVSLASWTHDGDRFVTAFIRDISERIRVEEAARVADLRLRRLVDANLFGIQVADAGGRVFEANDYWLRLTGWTREELDRGVVDWRAVTAPELLPADDNAITEMRATGTCAPFEKEYVRRDGTRTPALVVRMTLPGDGEQLASLVLDVSALRDATRGLARLAAAIDQTSESVVITDTESHIVYVNPAFERTSGYSAAEVVGQNPRILQSGVHADTFYQKLWATLVAGEAWHGELINRRKDGTHYTEVASISPIHDAEGLTTAYVAVKRDVTGERELETLVRQGQRLDILGQLAGGVAHDFNNLLAAIRGYGEFVQAALPEGSSVRADIDEVLRAASRATALTRQLLVFSRRQAVAPQEVRPSEVIAETAAMLRRLVGDHIEVVTRLDPGAGTVLADPGGIEQVVMNLALNARDAMPDGGRLEISTQHRPSTASSPAQVRVVVSDTGCGMDRETLARIYEPFFTTKEPGKGTGLGLATTYGIVQACGGQIRVESTVGTGTVFEIDLPAVVATVRESAEEPEADHGSETILVVEDERATRAVVNRMLVGLGYRVVEASSAQEALAMMDAGTVAPDLLLTDVRMPGIQGPELARRLLASRPGLPIVFMSAFADDLSPETAGLQSIRLLDKPFGSDELGRAIRAALDEEGRA